MGLSVVHGILVEIGGAICVKSEPGKGASFEVFLPKTSATPVYGVSSCVQTKTCSARLLIVDDEIPIVEAFQKSLSHVGFKVTAVPDAREGLRLFQENPYGFDLVITDQTMPHLTGLELAEKIHGIRPDIPIILCTGFSETVTQERLSRAGIRRFMMKPIISSELTDVINEILKGVRRGEHIDC